MPFGALKTLLLTLQAAPTLAGVSVIYGEEDISAQDALLPVVVVVPVEGAYSEPGYSQNLDPNIENIAEVRESIDLHLWAVSSLDNPQPVDNADAIETLRAQVLQAFWSQRATGLFWKPISERWVTDENAVDRYGRALVITVQADISVPDVSPTEATIQTVEVDPTI